MQEGFELLAKDTEDLIGAVEENIFFPDDIPNLHARTEYDNIRQDALQEIKEWLYDEGSAFHKRARHFLSQYDLDIYPDRTYKEGRVKVTLGAFSRLLEDNKKDEEPK